MRYTRLQRVDAVAERQARTARVAIGATVRLSGSRYHRDLITTVKEVRYDKTTSPPWSVQSIMVHVGRADGALCAFAPCEFEVIDDRETDVGVGNGQEMARP